MNSPVKSFIKISFAFIFQERHHHPVFGNIPFCSSVYLPNFSKKLLLRRCGGRCTYIKLPVSWFEESEHHFVVAVLRITEIGVFEISIKSYHVVIRFLLHNVQRVIKTFRKNHRRREIFLHVQGQRRAYRVLALIDIIAKALVLRRCNESKPVFFLQLQQVIDVFGFAAIIRYHDVFEPAVERNERLEQLFQRLAPVIMGNE